MKPCGSDISSTVVVLGVLTSNRRGGRRTTLADWTWCHCSVPLLGTIAGRCHVRMPLLGALAECHCWVLAIAGYQSMAGCHCWVLWWGGALLVPWLGSDFGRLAVP